MDQYPPAEEWPSWCRGSSHGAYLVKSTFLGALPDFTKGGQNGSVLDQVSNIRLRRLMHYKRHTDWNHEFIRAGLVHEGNGGPLIMVWERDLPLLHGKRDTKRNVKIKSGFPCKSTDRVSYTSPANIDDLIKKKEAYCLRYFAVTHHPSRLDIA